MKNIGGAKEQTVMNASAFIDFTVKIMRLIINCKVIYNRYKHHWTKIREIFRKWQKRY